MHAGPVTDTETLSPRVTYVADAETAISHRRAVEQLTNVSVAKARQATNNVLADTASYLIGLAEASAVCWSRMEAEPRSPKLDAGSPRRSSRRAAQD